jgi:uncharacterized protein YPO0396
MEVFNWGTFNGKVYKLLTNGKTSLLTGANGSGKTTLVDALLTLLVPGNKRFYNQSSGAEMKKERDENSYFWGHFGKTYSESEERSQTEQLRHKSDNPYSVLLACFQNAGSLHTITLVQVRWHTNAGLRKVFIVCPYQLNITEHFGKGHFDTKGEWRKKLGKQFPKTDIFDSFKEYASRFSDLFGLKEKALSLFNQTVGIKVLGDLTQFMRQQMLEEPEAEEQFKSLYDHYNDLLISHKAIQKDEKQLELLQPIVKNSELLKELRSKKETLEFIEEQMPFYLGSIEYSLLDKHIAKLEIDIDLAKKEKEVTATAIIQSEAEKEQLVIQKAATNVDNQILLLNKDISSESEKRDAKNKHFSQYELFASKLNLNTSFDDSSFKENFEKIVDLNTSLQMELDALSENRTRTKIEIEAKEHGINTLQSQITSLLSRKNRIPDELIAVRKRLLDLFDAGEDELPFAGELIKVKENQLAWEDSIEKVLHSFAMQLLVPDKYAKQVNQFVYSNNLQARLVYQKIDRKPSYSLMRWPADEDAMINKIELKGSGIYNEWLENYLVERYNYFCTDDLDVFYGSSKAITSNGLIRNVNRHEKDDRPGRWDKSRYRLGWDNRASVLFLQEEKNKLIKEHKHLKEIFDDVSPIIKQVTEKIQIVTVLAGIKSFDEINWKQHAEKVNTLSRQVDELQSSSDVYKTLSAQLKQVENELSEMNAKKENQIKRINTLEIEYNQKNLRKFKIDYEKLIAKGTEEINKFLLDEAINNSLPDNLEQLETLNIEIGIKFKSRRNKANNEVSQMEMQTNSLIAAFIHPGEAITKEFPDWSGDVMNIAPSLSSLDELDDLFKTIRNQRLVEHKRRFREYMDKSMLDALTNYRTWLTNEEDKIKEVIEELNVPLKKITFNKNPDTYLQLEYRPTKEQEIKQFKEQLSATIPNALEFATKKDEAFREEVFNKIKELITELQKEEVWRKKVTDIRNWLSFNAREYSVAENKAGQFHENTASYSGGQKAQFTYAILGAAIAHQFGIFQVGKQHKSLRFITVDEAFSKLDPEKSQFLMEFCAQLNLQLLVVTPLDKINIAEPYINAVHFVEIKNKKNSILYNLTMEEYYERKEEFKQLAETSE